MYSCHSILECCHVFWNQVEYKIVCFISGVRLSIRSFVLFIVLIIYPIELVMKLKENLSFTRYFPWNVSGQYPAYLGFPERFGHFVGLK